MGHSKVKSAERALEVLQFLGERAVPVYAATISRCIGLPKSSTYHLLNVMRDRGFVAYYPDARAWGLGAVARSIGTGHTTSSELAAIGRPTLESLTARCGASAALAVLLGADVIIAVRVDPAGAAPRRGMPVPGVRLPAHLSGYGRAILMHEPPARVEALFPYAHAIAPVRRSGAHPYADLLGLLQDQARSGVGSDEAEIGPGIISVAAPVFDHLGLATASIGVSYPAALRSTIEREAIHREVGAAAASLSQRLGHRPVPAVPAALTA